ncbi:hypothetical protein BGX34_012096 [Mortierella sp. NVP85]|nr:hypothetical protein BGX34_012096 [Mortierella sp. NVP85]
MSRLLRVNKATCAATLPFLYSECFSLKMHEHRPRSQKSTFTTMSQLVRILLQQISLRDQIPQVSHLAHRRIPGLLQIAYFPQDHQGGHRATADQPTPVFEYGRFIRKIVLDQDLKPYTFDFHSNPHIMEYAATHQLYNKYTEEGLISGTPDDLRYDTLVGALAMDIKRQLTWTLCQVYSESVQELSIPSTNLERYTTHIDRFRSLSKVIFTLEKIIRFSDSLDRGPSQRYTEQEWERNHLFRSMVHFVQMHTVVHSGVLRHVVLPDSYHIPGIPHYPVDDIKFEMLTLLPPPQAPRTITNHNWCEIVARLPDVNLNHVESICLQHFGGTVSAEKTLELLSRRPPLLPRCRALKHLEMESLGPNMFHWAVLEKERQQESVVDQHGGSSQNEHQSDPVPLRTIKLIHRTPSEPVQVLNDAAFAFSDSLEVLNVRDYWDTQRAASTDLGTAPVVVHGRDWTLRHLRDLHFMTFYSQLHFDMDALHRFYALERLHLGDMITTYNHRDLRSWPSVSLPCLKGLVLHGSPALFFNTGSLHRSSSLKQLHLSMSDLNGLYYIPSHDDLECDEADSQDSLDSSDTLIGDRPQLTWDWDLAELRELDLRAVFAFTFDFQWLQHLPNIQSVILNSDSTDGILHVRRIKMQDLLKRPDQPYRGPDALDQYFASPKLKQIVLHGHWKISAKVLKVLCLAVAPNLHEIHLGANCAGHSLQDWVTVSRKMHCVEQLRSDRQFADHEIQASGLISSIGPQKKYINKRLVEHILSGEKFLDVLDL